jgi:TetR/AcrR family transcriptional repressor of nem operon
MFYYICVMIQEQKSEQTREIILRESFKLFYENGFKSTSVDKIMKATKLTKGAFYHHYKNKKELGLDVISLKVQKKVSDGMITPFLVTQGDPLTVIQQTFTQLIKSYTPYQKQHGCVMNNLINEIADYEVIYQKALKKIIEEWKSALTELIERGKTEKSIKAEVASSAVAIYLISSFEGIRGLRKLYNDDTILEEYLVGLTNYLSKLATK